MTTLPTTTTAVRMPRSGPGSQALAMPQPSVLAPATASTGGAMTAGDVVRVLRANFWMILIFLVVSAVLGFLANRWLLSNFPKYTAVGFIKVEPPRAFFSLDKLESDMPDVGPLGIMTRTQAQLLRQPTLYGVVLGNINADIQNTGWIEQFKENGSLNFAKAREDLEDNFIVSPVQDSQLVRIAMTCKSAKDARIIVQDIVNQHLNEQDKNRKGKTVSRTEQLNVLKKRLDFLIQQKQQELRKMQKDLNDAGMAATSRMSPREAELYELTRKQIELNTEFEQAKQQYDNIAGQMERGIDPPMIEAFVNQDQQVYNLKNQITELEVSLRSTPRMGPGSQQAEMLRGRLAATQQALEDRIAEVRIQSRLQLRSNAEQNLSYAQGQYEAVSARVSSLRSELGELNYKIFEAMSAQDDLAADKERAKKVNEQLDLLGITGVRDQTGVDWAGGGVDEPEIPSFPKLSVTLPVAMFLGLALSLGIAFLREAMDTTVRSPRDIARVGQLNLLGMVPDENDDPQVEGVPLPLAIFQAPTSVMAEQFRQIRTRLQHAASLDTTRSILITSPAAGDGKSTVACNIAAGLALNGRRILLVDVNFRRPGIHKIFNVANEAGFGSVMNDLGNFENVVKQTQVPNLDVLPCGPKVDNPTELIESQRFVEFVEKALETYDHVLFDSGPLLLVSETVALAPRVDGVVTVVRAATNTRGVLQRLRDSLRQTKAEHLGVILNGVQAQGGGYYGRNIRDYYEYQNGHAK